VDWIDAQVYSSLCVEVCRCNGNQLEQAKQNNLGLDGHAIGHPHRLNVGVELITQLSLGMRLANA
jgi:hypothetical protein